MPKTQTDNLAFVEANTRISAPLHLRVFLSSPGDVQDERRVAWDLIANLAHKAAFKSKLTTEVIAWDDPHAPAPMDATETPQDTVNRHAGRPADCDLTIVLIWSRLGTPLPRHFCRADGRRFESGTIWELEDARDKGRPVWIYRRTEKPRLDIDDSEFESKREDFRSVEAFFADLTLPDGSIAGGYNRYSDLATFHTQLAKHLDAFARQQLDAADEAKASQPTTRTGTFVIDKETTLHDDLSGTKRRIDDLTVGARGAGSDARGSLFHVHSTAADPGPIPLQLPAMPVVGRLVGRGRERQVLYDCLQRGEDAAVIGPAGFGKTALAAVAIRDLIGSRGEHLAPSPFPDGVVILDLYRYRAQPDAVYGALASALLGDPGRPGCVERDRAQDACRNKRILVIIEGAEQADGADGRIAFQDLLAILDGRTRQLILTRDTTLTVPARPILLGEPLSVFESAELLELAASRPFARPLLARLLEQLQGHVLALSWAGGLLGRGDEHPDSLADTWRGEGLAPLSEPHLQDSWHTLQWLFERTVRSLPAMTGLLLESAALLAKAPFPLSALQVVLADAARSGGERRPDRSESAALSHHVQRLVQAGMLRQADERDHWQVAHVLPYQFARSARARHANTLVQLGAWLDEKLLSALSGDEAAEPMLDRWLLHADALLRADRAQRLRSPLVEHMFHEVAVQCVERGLVGLARRAIESVDHWLAPTSDGRAPVPSACSLVRADVLNRLGGVQRGQGDLDAARCSFHHAHAVCTKLLAEDRANVQCQEASWTSLHDLGCVQHELGDTTAARRSFDECLELVTMLAARDPDEPKWQQRLSVLHSEFGYGRGEPTHVALPMLGDAQELRERSIHLYTLGREQRSQGDLIAARQSFEQSCDIREKLSAADPNNVQWQRDLYNSLEQLASVQRELCDFAAALRSYEQCHDITDKWVALDPDSARWRLQLADLLDAIAGTQQNQSDLDAALQSLERSHALMAKITEAEPGNARWQRALSASFNNLGRIQRARGDLSAAQASFEAGRAIRKQLVLGDEDNLQAQRDLQSSLDQLGAVQRERGELVGAQQSFEQSRDIAARRVAVDGDNALWQRELSLAVDSLAEVQRERGDLAAAARSFTESLAIATQLAAAKRDDETSQRDLSISFLNLGRIQSLQGELAAALRSFEHACEIAARLAAERPGQVSRQRDLARCLRGCGQVQLMQRDLVAARRSFEQVREIRAQLVATEPKNMQFRREFVDCIDLLCPIRHEQRDFAGLQHCLEEACESLEELVADNPVSTRRQLELSIGLNWLGRTRNVLGDRDAARACFEQSRTIRALLVQRDPDNVQRRRELASSLHQLGCVQLEQRDLGGARQTFEQEYETRVPIVTPDDESGALELADRLEKLGELQLEERNLDGAQRAFEQACKLRAVLVAAHPNDATSQFKLSAALNCLGRVQKARADLAAAQQTFKQALDIRERLVLEEPSDGELKIHLASSLRQLGGVQSERADYAGALKSFEQVCALQSWLVKRHPDAVQFQLELSRSFTELGHVHWAQGHLLDAQQSFEHENAIHAELVLVDQNDPERRRDLLRSIGRVHAVQVERGDVEGAQRSLALRAKLTDSQHAQEALVGPGELTDADLDAALAVLEGAEPAAHRTCDAVEEKESSTSSVTA